MLQTLLACCLVAALTPQQSRNLVDRYNQVQAAVGGQDYRRAADILSGLVRDYGRSEFGNELTYALAETHFNLGEPSRALALFNSILGRPRYSYIKPEAMYGAALCNIMTGDYRQAQLTLERLAKEKGYDTDKRTDFAFGVLHYFQKDYGLAAARLDGIDLPEAKFYLGKCYAQLGRPMPALLKFREITADVPNTPMAILADFAAGQALFTNGDFDGARAKFSSFINNFPYSPLVDYARYFLGCALLGQSEPALAIEQLLPLTRNKDNFLAAHANYFVGYADMALNKPQAAVERFQRVRANYPRTKVASYANLQLSQAMLATADTAQSLLSTSQLAQMFTTGDLSGVGNYLSGVIHYQAGDYAKAGEQFNRVLVNYGQTALREPACSMLLLALNGSAQFDRTIALGTKHVADFPADTSAWRARTLYFLAEALYYSRKFSEADVNYQRAYGIKAGSDIAADARLGRCYCLYHLGRLDEAVGGFKSLLAVRPVDTTFTIAAYLGYGYSLFNQKEYLKALDVFEALTNTYPTDSTAAVPGYFYAGYCYYQLKYYGQAVETWTKLTNMYPENGIKVAEAAFRAGDTYFKALAYDDALAAFGFVVERYPYADYAPPSQALIAQCYYNRRQFLEAVREYQKFLDLYPSDPQGPGVRRSLEMSYYLAGQEDSAVMEEFLNRFPQSEMAGEGQYKKGSALYDAGEYAQAIVELQQAVVNFPGSPVAADAQLLTGQSYSQLKRWPEAAQAFQRFIDYYPEHEQRAGAWFNLGTALFNGADYEGSLQAFKTVLDSFPDSEYTESARKNTDICRKRLDAGRLGGTGSETEPPAPGSDQALPPPARIQGDNQP